MTDSTGQLWAAAADFAIQSSGIEPAATTEYWSATVENKFAAPRNFRVLAICATVAP